MASALLTLLKAVEISKKGGSFGKSARKSIDDTGTALEHDVPGKMRVDAIEEEFNALKKSDEMKRQPDEVISDIAEQNVQDALDQVTPKKSFKGKETMFAVDTEGVAREVPTKTGVAGRERSRKGRKEAIKRGDQKYMPRGNKADDAPQADTKLGEETQPTTFNRESLSDPRLSRGKIGPTRGDEPRLLAVERLEGSKTKKVKAGKSGLEETVDLPANFNRLDAGDQRKIMKPRDTREEQRIAIARINKAEDKGQVKREEDLAREDQAIAQENRESGEFLARDAVEEFSGEVPLNKARRINNELSGDAFSATGGSAKDRAALEQLDDLFGDNRIHAEERIREQLEKQHMPYFSDFDNNPVLGEILSDFTKAEQASFRVQEIMAVIEELRGSVPEAQFMPIWRKASQLAEIIRGSDKKNIPPSPERLGELEQLVDSITQMPKGSQGNLNFRGDSPARVASPAQQQAGEFDLALENLNLTDTAVRPGASAEATMLDILKDISPARPHPMLGHNKPPK